MPARVLDGEGVWRSKKIKAMAPKYRAEYANLLPLAEANGVFDADPERVWSDVYVFNRPDISLEDVACILNELCRVGLLRRWQDGSRTWGYWIGIEKSGRLPSGVHLSRYKNLPPNPPPEGQSTGVDASGTDPGISGTDPAWFGMDRSGLVLVRSNENENEREEEEMKAIKHIEIYCQSILGVRADMTPQNQILIKALEEEHKGSVIVNAFKAWAKEHVYDEIRKPVSAFLAVAQDLLGHKDVQTFLATDPAVKNLCREMSYLSDNTVAFDHRHTQPLSELLKEYTPEEIIESFRFFFANKCIDDYQLKYAANNFVQTADQMCYATKRKKREAAQQEALVARKAEEMQREAEEERRKRAEAAKQQEELVEDTLGD